MRKPLNDTVLDLSKLTNSSPFLMKQQFTGCRMTCRRPIPLVWCHICLLVWKQDFLATTAGLVFKFRVTPPFILWLLSPS